MVSSFKHYIDTDKRATNVSPKILNFLLWCLIWKVSIRKIIMLVWLCCMKRKTIIIMKIKGVTRTCTEGRQSWESENAQLTSEFEIVEKFGSHLLCHLASSLLNVVGQVDENVK